MWGPAEDSIISQSIPRGMDREMDDSPTPSKLTEMRPSVEQNLNKSSHANRDGKEPIKQSKLHSRANPGSLTQRGARNSIFNNAPPVDELLNTKQKPMMITRLTSRHKSTVRAPHGPSSTGFPSVRSKMLHNEEVRGDTFFDN